MPYVLVGHTTFKSMDYYFLWYLENACSRHMFEGNPLFEKIELTNGGTMTFDNGSKSIVEVKGSIEIHGLPILYNICEGPNNLVG